MMKSRLMVSVEELLNAVQYEKLVYLLLDLKEEEPKEVMLGYYDDPSWRIGYCDCCGNRGLVQDFYATPGADDTILTLCPHCNGGYDVIDLGGGRFRLVKAKSKPVFSLSFGDDVDRFEQAYEAHLLHLAGCY